MITTLTGENSFALLHDLHARTAAFALKHSDMAVERVDGQEASYERIQEALTSLPFLVDRKLVVLRAASANKQFAENVEQVLRNIPDSTEVVIVEPKLDKRSTYYKYLKTHTEYIEYQELDPNGLSRWLSEQATKRGGKLSSTDAHYLVERVGGGQQLLSNELDKLLLNSLIISRKTIDLLTDATPQSTIFDLLEAAFQGRTKLALQIYQEQRALKVEPQQIIAMLGWQLHIVAIVKAAGTRSPDTTAKEAKLSPFVVRKTLGIAKGLSMPQIKQLITELLWIDTKSKRTMLDLDEALQHFILKLAN